METLRGKKVNVSEWKSGLFGITMGIGWEHSMGVITSQADGIINFKVTGTQIYYVFFKGFIEITRQDVDIIGYYDAQTNSGKITQIRASKTSNKNP